MENGNTFKKDNTVKTVSLPCLNGFYSKRKEFVTIWIIFRRDLVCREPNKKSHELCPLYNGRRSTKYIYRVHLKFIQEGYSIIFILVYTIFTVSITDVVLLEELITDDYSLTIKATNNTFFHTLA